MREFNALLVIMCCLCFPLCQSAGIGKAVEPAKVVVYQFAELDSLKNEIAEAKQDCRSLSYEMGKEIARLKTALKAKGNCPAVRDTCIIDGKFGNCQ